MGIYFHINSIFDFLMTMDIKNRVKQLFEDQDENSFLLTAFAVYRYQSESNKVYRRYLDLMGYTDKPITSLHDIPLMPISFFKHHKVISGDWDAETVFKSSGTMGMVRSLHHVKSLGWYNEISHRIFYSFYNKRYEMLALLPSYLENGDSSLVHMVKHLTEDGDVNRFHLYDFNLLHKQILQKLNSDDNAKVLLWGVTYALLDFVETFKIDDERLEIIFTGGMKRRGEELDFDTVIDRLSKGFPSSKIAAEYGMTELFSQAYAQSDGVYHVAKTMRVLTKDFNDLTSPSKTGKSGQLGIIDLANVDTLAFIQTDDIAHCHNDEKFELYGRMTNSDLRGCNMLYEV